MLGYHLPTNPCEQPPKGRWPYNSSVQLELVSMNGAHPCLETPCSHTRDLPHPIVHMYVVPKGQGGDKSGGDERDGGEYMGQCKLTMRAWETSATYTGPTSSDSSMSPHGKRSPCHSVEMAFP